MSVNRMSSDEPRPARASLRARVVAAGEHWLSGQRELIRLIAELDRSSEWSLDGSTTCAHWVAGALDVELSTAREWVRIGRALADLPTVNGAFRSGRLSYSKVRVLTRVASDANEAELCELAARIPAARLAHAVAAWLQRHETPEETEARHASARGFGSRIDVDGTGIAWLRLPPGEMAALTATVDADVLRRRPGDASAGASVGATDRWPSVAQQRADALVKIVTTGGRGVACEVVMHVRADGCSLDDGTPIAGTVIERIAPRAFLRALIHDAQRRPINASGRRRHPTARQRRVVHERDRACVDCGATEFLQYDHDPPFEETGRTVVEELYLRCWTCHRKRHPPSADP